MKFVSFRLCMVGEGGVRKPNSSLVVKIPFDPVLLDSIRFDPPTHCELRLHAHTALCSISIDDDIFIDVTQFVRRSVGI